MSIWLSAYNLKHFGAFLWLLLLLVCFIFADSVRHNFGDPRILTLCTLLSSKVQNPSASEVTNGAAAGARGCSVLAFLLFQFSLWGAVYCRNTDKLL